MQNPPEKIDLDNPPASRPTWATLAYAVAIALGLTVIGHWPSIARFLDH
jgi:hypothetical protein